MKKKSFAFTPAGRELAAKKKKEEKKKRTG